MIDYAREASLELHNMFYEIDDILDYKYDVVTEGEMIDTTATVVSDSDGTSTKSSARAVSDNTSGSAVDPKNDPKKNNANLKNTTGFVAKLKALVEKIVNGVKEAIAKISEKLVKLGDERHAKYMKMLQEAKNKNGFKSIEIENYQYNGELFEKFANNISSAVQSLDQKIDVVYNSYKTNMSFDDSHKREVEQLVENFDQIYELCATRTGLKTTKGATPDTIYTEFQNAFRGEKSQFKVSESYATQCETWVNNTRHNMSGLATMCNYAKNLAKKINDQSKSLTTNPGTDTESNNLITKYTSLLGKFAAFQVKASSLLLSLEIESVTNAKIVLQRVYNFNAMGVKSPKKVEGGDQNKIGDQSNSNDDDDWND